MKKVMSLLFVPLALFADEKQKNANVKPAVENKIIACGQVVEKRTILGIYSQMASYDWYLFDDNVLLVAGEEAYKQETVTVESTKKDNQIIITKIKVQDNPERVMDFTTGKVMQAEYEIGEVSQGTECLDLKDFYESIRKSGKELVSRADILKQNIEKREKEVNRSKRALLIAEKNRLDK